MSGGKKRGPLSAPPGAPAASGNPGDDTEQGSQFFTVLDPEAIEQEFQENMETRRDAFETALEAAEAVVIRNKELAVLVSRELKEPDDSEVLHVATDLTYKLEELQRLFREFSEYIHLWVTKKAKVYVVSHSLGRQEWEKAINEHEPVQRAGRRFAELYEIYNERFEAFLDLLFDPEFGRDDFQAARAALYQAYEDLKVAMAVWFKTIGQAPAQIQAKIDAGKRAEEARKAAIKAPKEFLVRHLTDEQTKIETHEVVDLESAGDEERDSLVDDTLVLKNLFVHMLRAMQSIAVERDDFDDFPQITDDILRALLDDISIDGDDVLYKRSIEMTGTAREFFEEMCLDRDARQAFDPSPLLYNKMVLASAAAMKVRVTALLSQVKQRLLKDHAADVPSGEKAAELINSFVLDLEDRMHEWVDVNYVRSNLREVEEVSELVLALTRMVEKLGGGMFREHGGISGGISTIITLIRGGTLEEGDKKELIAPLHSRVGRETMNMVQTAMKGTKKVPKGISKAEAERIANQAVAKAAKNDETPIWLIISVVAALLMTGGMIVNEVFGDDVRALIASLDERQPEKKEQKPSEKSAKKKTQIEKRKVLEESKARKGSGTGEVQRETAQEVEYVKVGNVTFQCVNGYPANLEYQLTNAKAIGGKGFDLGHHSSEERGRKVAVFRLKENGGLGERVDDVELYPITPTLQTTCGGQWNTHDRTFQMPIYIKL